MTLAEEGEHTMSNDVQTKNAESGSPAESSDKTPALIPRVDVLEDATGITLLADLPGVPKDQLVLKVEGDTLLVEGTVAPLTPGKLEATYAELRVPRYRRGFTLSRELDAEHIDANLKDGVLRLRIPKQAHAQPRRIQIQTA
jgi:HSP20 family molecular chaperone IbpA